MLNQTYKIHNLKLGPLENFIYLIEDIKTRECAVVDPAWDVDAIINRAHQQELNITQILLTHSHHDHINGIEGLLNHTSANINLLKDEYDFWDKKLEKPELHYGGDQIQLGRTDIKILHTPGHTPGSACYQIGDNLITGDTMFVYGCGRCDLHGGNPQQMFNTLKKMKESLNPHCVIHPGHDYAIEPTATVSEQLKGNPFLHFKEEESFIGYRMEAHDKTRVEPYAPVSAHQLRVMDLLK